MDQPTFPVNLPWCTYPPSSEIQQHGLFNLQKELPLINFGSARKFRSHKYTTVPLIENDKPQILELARIIANSFAINEPMNRHVHPPRQIPKQIIDVTHSDAFGNDPFGAWTTENLLFWFVRLILMTDPSHPIGAIRMNDDDSVGCCYFIAMHLYFDW